jgi:hypothetical protein
LHVTDFLRCLQLVAFLRPNVHSKALVPLVKVGRRRVRVEALLPLP